MGFFDNLLDGVSSATSWVVHHSDDIANVAGVIAKVANIPIPPGRSAAELTAGTGVGDDDPTTLPVLYQNITSATAYLGLQAQTIGNKASSDLLSQLGVGNGGTLYYGPVWGLWQDVSHLTGQSNEVVAPNIYRDVASLLANQGLPLWDGDFNSDIANALALGMFGNSKTGLVKSDVFAQDGCLYSNFAYQRNNKSLIIFGCHYFLPLPVSLNQKVSPWLSGLYFTMSRHNSVSLDYMGLGLAHKQLYKTWAVRDPTESGWSITVRTLWANVGGLDGIIHVLIAGLQALHPEWKGAVGVLQGVSWTLKLFATVKSNDTPSSVRQGVLDYAQIALQSPNPPLPPPPPGQLAQGIVTAEVDGTFVAGDPKPGPQVSDGLEYE